MALITVHTDGGSRGNPGASAWGAVIEREDGGKRSQMALMGYLGNTTNNVAEYSGLRAALKALLDQTETGDTVRMFADSKLMVDQVNGVWQCHSEQLYDLWIECTALIQLLRENGVALKLSHVRRHLNTEADALVNQVLDEEEVSK